MSPVLKDVYRAVFEARAKWHGLGIELGVQPHIIDSLPDRNPPEKNLSAILTAWLKVVTAVIYTLPSCR